MIKHFTIFGYLLIFILCFTEYALSYSESPLLSKMVRNNNLPPVELRLPQTPRIIDFASRNLEIGKYGGTIKMLMARAKDARQMTVYGYARLVIFKPKTFEFQPDILESFTVIQGKKFIFNLRPGHKWSDGSPFSAEDFRYWWEDVANNPKLSPVGPPKVMKVEGKLPQFRILSNLSVQYEWEKPNPDFLPALASASPLYIYRPAHYMRQFHKDFAANSKLQKLVTTAKQRNWAALHNKMDNLYRNDNIDLPVLQPWVCVSKSSSNRLRFKRNAFFHRIDPQGQQLPYVDEFIFGIANNKLISAKTGTGEVDLQARYLRFDDYTFLKKGEDRSAYSTRLWPTAKGSHLALFPNLNNNNKVLQSILRDVRFRRALSMAVDRYEINQVIYYGLAIEGNNTVLPESPLYKSYYRSRWAQLDLKASNKLLDDMGLTERDSRGIRLMPDGNPLNLIVETAGESTEQTDILELIHDNWLKIGIKIYSKPSQRNVFRNRIFAGETAISIWSGIENGLASANSSPAEFAPTTQQLLQWPKWGQNFETDGKSGHLPDDPYAIKLLDLYRDWRAEPVFEERAKIWEEILDINTEQVYSIGLIAGVLQPVVVSNNLKNVPVKGIYNWNPGAHFGIYSPDTFWFEKLNQNKVER